MCRLLVFVLLLATLLTTISDRLRGDEPIQRELAKGTRAMAVKLAKDKVPANVIPGVNVDIIAKITEPIQTAIAILNVRVLAIDKRQTGEQSVTVQVTPTQALILAQLQKDGLKLGVKIRNQTAWDEL